MKTVKEMSDEEWVQAVKDEATRAKDELKELLEELIRKGQKDGPEVHMALALTMLAKERVWRKDLDERLKKVETALSPFAVKNYL